MTASNVKLFTKWRKNRSAAEMFEEMAEYARQRPERFERVVILYAEDNEKALRPTYRVYNCTTLQVAGMIAIGQQELFETTLRPTE